MKKGFTLIELMITVAIIGILATVVMLNLASAQKKSRDSQRKSDLTQIASSLETYKVDLKQYPNDTASKAGFVNISSSILSLSSTSFVPNYIAKLPVDPLASSGNIYQYMSDGQNYKLIATAPETLVGLGSSDSDKSKAQKLAGDFYDAVNVTGYQISSSSVSESWDPTPPEGN